MGRMNHRTWRRAEWKIRGEGRSPGYAIQGEYKACPVAPRAAEGAIICDAGAAPYGGYMDGPGRGKTSAWLGTYWGIGVSGRWPLLGSLHTRRLAILTDRLGWRGGLFLEWASAVFGDGERHGRGELPEDNSSFAGRSMSSGAAIPLPLP